MFEFGIVGEDVVVGDLMHGEARACLCIRPVGPAGPTVVFEGHSAIDLRFNVLSPDHAEISHIKEVLPLFMVPDIIQGIGIVVADNDALQLISMPGNDSIGFTAGFDGKGCLCGAFLLWRSQMFKVIAIACRKIVFYECCVEHDDGRDQG